MSTFETQHGAMKSKSNLREFVSEVDIIVIATDDRSMLTRGRRTMELNSSD